MIYGYKIYDYMIYDYNMESQKLSVVEYMSKSKSENGHKKRKKYRNSKKGKRTITKKPKELITKNAEALKKYYQSAKGILQLIKRSAKRRGIDFSLTPEAFKYWWETTDDICDYCKSTLKETIEIKEFLTNYKGKSWLVKRFKRFYGKRQKELKRLTIDRVDNSKGYSIDNICKCCLICNRIKSNFFTGKEFHLIAPTLIKNLKEEMNSGK